MQLFPDKYRFPTKMRRANLMKPVKNISRTHLTLNPDEKIKGIIRNDI